MCICVHATVSVCFLTALHGSIATLPLPLLSAGQAAPNFGSFGSAQAAAYKIFEVVDRVPSIDVEATTGAKPAPETLRGRIEFVNVTFAYPSRPTETILRNFNLVVEPGTMVALVGESGSGKSTIMQLLQRFYDPQEGSVIVDGVDVKEWNLLYLRDHIGIVSQEPTLFGASVAENIAYGKAGFVAAGQAEIEAAAASANAHEFITNLPEGYDTIVGTSVSSTQLSGGQRQRICIARAVIRNPTYLLLDEATSALVRERLEMPSTWRTRSRTHRVGLSVTSRDLGHTALLQPHLSLALIGHARLLSRMPFLFALLCRTPTVSAWCKLRLTS